MLPLVVTNPKLLARQVDDFAVGLDMDAERGVCDELPLSFCFETLSLCPVDVRSRRRSP